VSWHPLGTEMGGVADRDEASLASRRDHSDRVVAQAARGR
jgi:hypothetical protein